VTEWMVQPFNETELKNDRPQIQTQYKKWNKKHSHAHIGLEHYFGRLKGCFPALKLIPSRDMTKIYLSVEALIIVHNILAEFHDSLHDIDGFSEGEIEEEVADLLAIPYEPALGPIRNEDEQQRLQQERDTDDIHWQKGVALRNHLVRHMISNERN
jgi:DDE superfamily endonuclease